MFHVVERNEILRRIAQHYGTTVAAFIAANPTIDPDLIRPGQVLTIPDSATENVASPLDEAPGSEPGTVVYSIRSGDTMGRIAGHFGVTLAQIKRANPQIPDINRIHPGQLVTIPAEVAPITAITATTVAKHGDPGWLAAAKREMDTGVDEVAGPGSNPRIVEYHRTTTLQKAAAEKDETPWCSSFVNWCVLQAGMTGTNSALARSWLGWGHALETPKRGAVTVFRRDGGPTRGHVAFFWQAQRDRILVLGGNQGNQVSIRGYRREDLLGFRWPASP